MKSIQKGGKIRFVMTGGGMVGRPRGIAEKKVEDAAPIAAVFRGISAARLPWWAGSGWSRWVGMVCRTAG